jgi:hypothetical protein
MENWTHIILPRTNLYGFAMPNLKHHSIGNTVHYVDVCEWCNKIIKESNLYHHEIDEATGVKHFWFKNAVHATIFSLRWA